MVKWLNGIWLSDVFWGVVTERDHLREMTRQNSEKLLSTI